MYDPLKPWVTHVSIQSDDFAKVPEWRSTFRKPLVFDECKYEGNIPKRWGDISARELTRRFWLGMANGAYVGHGETYLDPARYSLVVQGRRAPWREPAAHRIPPRHHRERPARRRCSGARRVLSVHRAPRRILSLLPRFPPARAGRFRPPRREPLHRGDHRSLGDDRHESRRTFSGKFQLKLPGREMLAVRFRKVA